MSEEMPKEIWATDTRSHDVAQPLYWTRPTGTCTKYIRSDLCASVPQEACDGCNSIMNLVSEKNRQIARMESEIREKSAALSSIRSLRVPQEVVEALEASQEQIQRLWSALEYAEIEDAYQLSTWETWTQEKLEKALSLIAKEQK